MNKNLHDYPSAKESILDDEEQAEVMLSYFQGRIHKVFI